MSTKRSIVKTILPLGALMLLLASSAGAATFTVTTADDGHDLDPGDGFCDAGNGACTLRAAVEEADARPDFDSVELPRGSRPFELTLGALSFGSRVDLQGGANEVVCSSSSDGLKVHKNGAVNVFNLRVSHCKNGVVIQAGGSVILSGAVLYRNQRGVDNAGGLLASGSLFLGGSSTDPGAAIRNRGYALARLFSCELNYNYSSDRGGAIHNAANAELIVQLVSFTENGAGNAGGAVFNEGMAEFDLVTFDGNTAPAGGAIENSGTSRSRCVVTRSSFVKNLATAEGEDMCGGAIRGYGGGVWVVNSTISTNQARGNGGGVCVRWGAVELANTTIVRNLANSDFNDYGGGGGIWAVDPGVIEMRNSIVAENEAAHDGSPDCEGVLRSDGFNLVGIADQQCTVIAAPGDLVGTVAEPVQAGIGELIRHSYTDYHPLLPGSVAIDSADPNGCSDPLTGDKLVYDQLEYLRHTGDGCDRGASEHQP